MSGTREAIVDTTAARPLRWADTPLYALQDRLRYRRAGHFAAMVVGVAAGKPGGA
ncbi:MAG: hypothetical protein DIU52_012100 [bacterium]